VSKKYPAQEGRIIFTGLRHAKKFAAREKIIQEIRGFFGRREVTDFGELRVKFSRKRKTSGALGRYSDGSLGRFYSPNPATIHVFVDKVHSREFFFKALFHELDHHWWRLQGRAEPDQSLSYGQMPSERRAFRVSCRETCRVLRAA